MNILYIITAPIKILVLVYLWKKFFSKKVDFYTKLFIFLIVAIYCIINIVYYPKIPLSINKSSSGEKTCFSIQREIFSAIEIYNMDAPKDKIIKNFDKEVFKKLVEEKILRESSSKPSSGCEILSKGDLTEDGFLYCKKHGDVKQRVKKITNKEEKKDSGVKEFFFMIDSWAGKLIKLISYIILFPLYLKLFSVLAIVFLLPLDVLGLTPPIFEGVAIYDYIAYYLSGLSYFLIIFILYYGIKDIKKNNN